jgi:hypothetical protein
LNCGRGTPISGPPSPRRLLGRRESRLARDVETPAQNDAEVGLRRLARVLDRGHEPALVDPAPGRGVRRDRQLGVPHVLPPQLTGHLVGEQTDVLGRPDQIHDGQIDVDEVREVREREVVDQRLGVRRHLRVRVARGEGGDDPRGSGAHVVDVQFGLRQPGDEGVQIGQGSSPGTAPVRNPGAARMIG